MKKWRVRPFEIEKLLHTRSRRFRNAWGKIKASSNSETEKAPRILHLNLHREFLAAISAKTKRIEYRRQTPYWNRRLEGRKYDMIHFSNGYAAKAPEMLVEFGGLRRYGKGRTAYFAIRLGRILKVNRWKL